MKLCAKEQNILQGLNMKINITENKYGLDIDKLFSLGARENKKRSFLFVSKVLGKHIPVNPLIPLKVGYLLGSEIANEPMPQNLLEDIVSSINEENNNHLDLNEIKKIKFSISEKTLFIGFAETATALGHSVFSMFDSSAFNLTLFEMFDDKKMPLSDNIVFLHTTREEVKEFKSTINFEEEHSHATSHFAYLLGEQQFDKVVLIDDEMTTGKTNLNLIKSLLKQFNIRNFVCMSILDWRNDEDIKKYSDLEKELDINIKVISLIKGNIECNNENVEIKKEEIVYNKVNDISFNVRNFRLNSLPDDYIECTTLNNNKKEDFLIATGKFGINTYTNSILTNAIYQNFEKLDLKFNEKTLFMGFGEFMYIPMYVAASINSNNIEFSSPSLSPIHSSDLIGYPIKNVDKIVCPYGIQKDYHIYNLNEEYKQVVLFLERQPSNEFLNKFKDICMYRGIKEVNVIIAS